MLRVFSLFVFALFYVTILSTGEMGNSEGERGIENVNLRNEHCGGQGHS